MDVNDLNYVFTGHERPPLVGAPDSGFWRSFTVGGGTPTVQSNNGFMELALDATLETQLACLYMGDELAFDIDAIQQVDFWCKLGVAIHPSVSLCFGLVAARNNDPDLITQAILFRAIGTANVVLETDDGVNDNDDVASGQQITTCLKRFTVDLASGVVSVVPGPSVGGKANVLFSIDDARNNLRGVGRGTRFDVSSYAGNFQLFAQIQKGSASSVVAADVTASLLIEKIRIRYKIGA